MVVEPTKKASAGRVLIKPRGEWNENTTYEMLDLVNHNGYAWLAKRTVVGIEPSDEYPGYWHNMLDIKTIVENNIAETVADEVGDILSERFSDMLSEARYVPDLMADFTEATFVQWNTETANTPYTEGLTTSTDGYALVYGNSVIVRTIVAWTNGETFTYGANGWEKAITSSGGTIIGSLELTGPLKLAVHLELGGGVGKVSADNEGTLLEANKDAENYRRVKVENPSGDVALEDAVKFVSAKSGETNEYSLLGEHNPDKIAEMGYAKIYTNTYIGDGEYGKEHPNTLSFDFKPALIMIFGTDMTGNLNPLCLVQGITHSYYGNASDTDVYMTWEGNSVKWYTTTHAKWQHNLAQSYWYVAIG